MNLTEMEWNVMELLWERGQVTGREAAEYMEAKLEWSRSTTLTHLRRMEAKGAVESSVEEGLKVFKPMIQREEAVVQETESFLSRIHKGSLSLMVSSLTEKQALPQEEIDRLYAILNQLKEPK